MSSGTVYRWLIFGFFSEERENEKWLIAVRPVHVMSHSQRKMKGLYSSIIFLLYFLKVILLF